MLAGRSCSFQLWQQETNDLFLLGHSVWGYFVSKTTGKALHVDIPIYLALLCGTLPDFDLYFGWLGLVHHTYTHSLLVLIPCLAVLVFFFRRKGIAFSAGVLSHILTDMMVGAVPILLPISTVEVGLYLGMPSNADAALEVGMLAVVLLYMWQNGDARALLKKDPKNLCLLIPLIAIVSLSLLASQNDHLQLATYAFSQIDVTAISAGHVVLGLVMVIGVLQGIRAIWKVPFPCPFFSNRPKDQP